MVQDRKIIIRAPLKTSFERSLAKLSKMFDIGSTVLKLWPLKIIELNPPPHIALVIIVDFSGPQSLHSMCLDLC